MAPLVGWNHHLASIGFLCELCLSSSAKSDESLVPFVWAMSADRPT